MASSTTVMDLTVQRHLVLGRPVNNLQNGDDVTVKIMCLLHLLFFS